MTYADRMDRRDQQTLEAIFEEPIPVMEWEAIEDLLVSIGCKVVDESEERVSFEMEGMIGSFQRPDERKLPLDHAVRAVRDYLTRLGVTP